MYWVVLVGDAVGAAGTLVQLKKGMYVAQVSSSGLQNVFFTIPADGIKKSSTNRKIIS
jgi:hypothetical protein